MMLQLTEFHKKYNGLPILAITEARFGNGLHWIKGGNGAGKSTLFKSIAGLIPFQGSIALDDIDMNRQPVAYRLRVNFSEAEPLYPSFVTPKDLIRFCGKIKGSTREHQDRLAATWGMSTFFSKPCGTFSSGMLKKVSLALAFLGHPRVIILDEPLITLDADAKNVLFDFIKAALNNQAIVLVSSHHPIEFPNLPLTEVWKIENHTLSHG
jgi:ABC-2 type transport system ATP-binding protein